MTRGSLVAVVVLLLVAAGGGVGWVAYRKYQATEQDLQALLASGAIEVQRDPPDHNALAALLRKVRESPAANDERLLRLEAQVLLALQRYQDAWTAIGPLVLRPEPPATADDLWLAARVSWRLYAARGETELIDRAMGFAGRAYEINGKPEAACMAWRCARRGNRLDERRHFAEQLRDKHAGTPEAKLVEVLEGDPPSIDKLMAVAREFEPVPEELQLAIAARLLESGRPADLEDARSRTQRVLDAVPVDMDARILAAFVAHRCGDRATRDAHLDWLLRTAAADDPRRANWSELRDAPVEGGR